MQKLIQYILKIIFLIFIILVFVSCDSLIEKKIIGKWENKDLDRIANVPCKVLTTLNFREDYTYEEASKYTPLYNDEYIKIGCLNSYYSNSLTLEFNGTWKIRKGKVIVEIESNNAGLNLEELGFEHIQSKKLSQLTDSVMILDNTKFKRIK